MSGKYITLKLIFLRPFLRLEGANEVERLECWEDLETGDSYSQGNWKDLNEFFEYCTEWEPTNSLYFGGKFFFNVPDHFTYACLNYLRIKK
jgi:hypothetical protein